MAKRRRRYSDELITTPVEAPPKNSIGSVLRRNNTILNPKHVEDDRYMHYLVSAGTSVNLAFREGKYLHVSDVIGKCGRMIALAKRYNMKMTFTPPPESMGLTFAMGNAIHDYIRGKVMRNAPEKIYGGWSCMCEKTQIVGTYAEAKTHDVCPHCRDRLNRYHEMVITNDDIMVSGAVDLSLLEGKALHLNEIKSIKHDAWKEMSRPLPEHVVQILFYWWLAREQGYDLYDAVSIFYATKGFVMFGTPYKEFVLQPSKMMGRLEEYLDEARDIKDAMNGGKMPVKTCMQIDKGDAKECPMAMVCFQHKDEK